MRCFRFISSAAMALFALGLSTSCTYSDKPAENKAIAQRAFEEVWNKGNLAAIDEIYASNYRGHGPATSATTNGPEEVKQSVTMYRNAFPDLHFTIDDNLATGNMVATRWTARGTHKGELMGTAPTDRQVTVAGISISRFVGGKIEEGWVSWDRMDLMQQLGVAPQMTKPAE